MPSLSYYHTLGNEEMRANRDKEWKLMVQQCHHDQNMADDPLKGKNGQYPWLSSPARLAAAKKPCLTPRSPHQAPFYTQVLSVGQLVFTTTSMHGSPPRVAARTSPRGLRGCLPHLWYPVPDAHDLTCRSWRCTPTHDVRQMLG